MAWVTLSPEQLAERKAVKEAILAVANTKGRTAAVELLAKFGVINTPGLKPEQYTEFLAAANELLNN